MAKEVITLGGDGSIGTEMFGFKGKSCLNAAADITKELERLGIITELGGIQMKDDAQTVAAVQQTALKVEQA
ncbi:MAG: hypothetical protein WC378_16595 [Opitutaceae bacterium]|jgi:virulence-associated protein VapD